jgi:superfamily II DNA/RNA helicase
MVFFNEHCLCHTIQKWLEDNLPDKLKGQTSYFEANGSKYGQARTWSDFKKGKVNILFCMDVAGMVRATICISKCQSFEGCDIPDIELVIQFHVPQDLSTWMQLECAS